ncbi:MAG TPA: periplasmic heavy metal sensor [Candidatus Binatia bacterium]|nr:periplasmic heavy metal sensor [Candidatus Binatia bacterium]
MVKRVSRVVLISFMWLFWAEPGSAVGQVGPAFHEELGRAWGVLGRELGRELEGLFDRWEEHFGSMGAREGPSLSMMIRNREKLGLSTEQVKNLERLRNDFEKESIRKEADIRVAKLDLHTLLDAQPVDMTKVEAKVREIERLRADLRFARIRTAQKGKEQLSADQRTKLEELLAESQFTLFQP